VNTKYVIHYVYNCYNIVAPTSSVRDLTAVSIENFPTAISLNWQPPRQTNGQITGMFCGSSLPCCVKFVGKF